MKPEELKRTIEINRNVDEEMLTKSRASLRELHRIGVSTGSNYNLLRPFSRSNRQSVTEKGSTFQLRSVR
jgi:hypothetical protein